MNMSFVNTGHPWVLLNCESSWSWAAAIYYILRPSYGPWSLIDQILIFYFMYTSLRQTRSRLTLTS